MRILCLAALLFSEPDYMALLDQIQAPKGKFIQGEIQIVTDPAEIALIEQLQAERLLKKGCTSEQSLHFSRVGVVFEDQYLILVRDAVIFPSGAKGTYDRLIWKASLSGDSGVAVMPILPDGKVVLNLNFRHATRAWELELPRGGIKPGETAEACAVRELKEETGLEIDTPVHLGSMAPDSGILGSIIPIFMGKVAREGLSEQEYSEAIAGIYAFSKQQIREGLKQGFLMIEGKKAYLRDPFLTFALIQAEYFH